MHYRPEVEWSNGNKEIPWNFIMETTISFRENFRSLFIFIATLEFSEIESGCSLEDVLPD